MRLLSVRRGKGFFTAREAHALPPEVRRILLCSGKLALPRYADEEDGVSGRKATAEKNTHPRA